LTLALSVALYGNNLLTYHRLEPHASQVLGPQQAMQYRIFARDHIVSEFRKDRISYEDAAKMALSIPHEGDRAGALELLRIAAIEKQQPVPRISRFRYASVWSEMMLGRIYGIMGHKSMIKNRNQLYLYYGIFILAAGLLVVNPRSCGMAGNVVAVSFIFTFYALVLMQLVNYGIYYESGSLSKALQGRYIFPVLAPIYALLACALMSPPRRGLRWFVLVIVGGIFLYGEFPFFLHHMTPDWFMGT
jgi:hypothetical protein